MNKKFTEGKILGQLIGFALPVLLALFLQATYGAVDLLVIGQFGNAADVSAVSTGSQIMQTVTLVIVGLAMGITVFAGQKIGEGRLREAGRVIGSGICLFAAVAVAATIIMLIFAKSIAAIMHAPEEAYDLTVRYVTVCSSGMVFIVAYNVIGSIFRGIGNSKVPLMTVVIACFLNIIGDLIFVAVFHLGVTGVAIATVLAQAISVVLSLIIITRIELPFTLTKKDIRFRKYIVKRILFLGIPIALQDLLVSVSFLVILAIVNSMGLIASAGVGVAEKLCVFIMLVPSAYMQSMSAFVAQNIGADKSDRAKKALLYGILSSLAVGIIMAYLSFFHGELLSAMFSHDEQVITASADYLKAYSIDCIFTSFLFCFAGFFNGCSKTMFVMIQGIIGAFCVRIPISYFVSRIAGVSLFYIGLATPASTVVQIILCVIFLIITEKRKGLSSASI